MMMRDRLMRFAGARMSRRMVRSLPFLGVVIGAATVVSAMRRKGVISGAFDTGINAVPFVGMAKNAVEVVRGRDFFPDRYGPGVAAPTRR
jgi:hypothetical protein